MIPLTHVSSMDRFLEALESLDPQPKPRSSAIPSATVVFFERMLTDRVATLRNTVLLYAFRFLSK